MGKKKKDDRLDQLTNDIEQLKVLVSAICMWIAQFQPEHKQDNVIEGTDDEQAD